MTTFIDKAKSLVRIKQVFLCKKCKSCSYHDKTFPEIKSLRCDFCDGVITNSSISIEKPLLFVSCATERSKEKYVYIFYNGVCRRFLFINNAQTHKRVMFQSISQALREIHWMKSEKWEVKIL